MAVDVWKFSVPPVRLTVKRAPVSALSEKQLLKSAVHTDKAKASGVLPPEKLFDSVRRKDNVLPGLNNWAKNASPPVLSRVNPPAKSPMAPPLVGSMGDPDTLPLR